METGCRVPDLQGGSMLQEAPRRVRWRVGGMFSCRLDMSVDNKLSFSLSSSSLPLSCTRAWFVITGGMIFLHH